MSANDTDYTALTPAMLLTGKRHEHLPIDAENVPTTPPLIRRLSAKEVEIHDTAHKAVVVTLGR